MMPAPLTAPPPPLLAAFDGWQACRFELLDATERLAEAKAALADREAAAWEQGQVVGKNAEDRAGCLRSLTDLERQAVLGAERDYRAAVAREDVARERLRLLRTLAAVQP